MMAICIKGLFCISLRSALQASQCPGNCGYSRQGQDRVRSWGAKCKDVPVLPDASSCAHCTVRPNKPSELGAEKGLPQG